MAMRAPGGPVPFVSWWRTMAPAFQWFAKLVNALGLRSYQPMSREAAALALLDIFDDKNVTVDYCRDNGFLKGFGIDVKDPKVMGDEAKKGSYKGINSGSYEIVGNVATLGNEDGGRTGMEKLLAKNPNIKYPWVLLSSSFAT